MFIMSEWVSECVLEHPYHLNGSTYPHVSVVEVQQTNKCGDAHSVQQQPWQELQRLRKIVLNHRLNPPAEKHKTMITVPILHNRPQLNGYVLDVQHCNVLNRVGYRTKITWTSSISFMVALQTNGLLSEVMYILIQFIGECSDIFK